MLSPEAQRMADLGRGVCLTFVSKLNVFLSKLSSGCHFLHKYSEKDRSIQSPEQVELGRWGPVLSKSGWYFTNEMAKGLCLVFCYIWRILPSFFNPLQLLETLALSSPVRVCLPMSHFFLRQGRVVLPMGGQRQEAQLEIYFGRGRDLGQKLVQTRLSVLLPSAHMLGEIQKPSQCV